MNSNAELRLPLVVSIIYYANKKPFSHSLDINEYFENSALAKKYAFTAEFVDLNRFSDEEILAHGFIAGYEIILKNIRQKQIDGKLGMAVRHIEMYDHIVRQVLIKYMSHYSDLENDAFYDKIIDSKPNLEGDVMTVAEQWKQQGMEKGMEKGELQGKKQIVRNMLAKGYLLDDIVDLTGLGKSVVEALKKEKPGNTRH